VLPLDMRQVILDGLAADESWGQDGLLHASSHLAGSLRHAQLEVAGAPAADREFAEKVTLKTGTLWHEWVAAKLQQQGRAAMLEVKMGPWMPSGWTGTADWILWSTEYQAFVLGDFKTSKGELIRWIERDGAKTAHLWQLSAYWYALRDAGFPLVRGFGVFYMPKNTVSGAVVEPVTIECDPIDEATLFGTMAERTEATKAYMESIGLVFGERPRVLAAGAYQSDLLAPVQERQLFLRWQTKEGRWDVRLEPDWSTSYCRFPDHLCDCKHQGTTKVGEWHLAGDGVEYVARKGYEAIQPPTPSATEVRKRQAKLAAANTEGKDA
jgi:hypothetical protein